MNNNFWKYLISKINKSTNPYLSYLLSYSAPALFTKKLNMFAGEAAPVWKNKKAFLAISFDVDFTEDVIAIPGVIDLLSKYKLDASFAVIGKWIEKYPEEHKLKASNCSEILNHTYSHPNNTELSPNRYFNKISVQEQEEEIIKCDRVVKDLLSVQPVGFRTPHFGVLHTNSVYNLLKKNGYLYSSSILSTSSQSYGLPFKLENGIWEVPISTCPKHPKNSFDTWHSLRKPKKFLKPGAWHLKQNEFLNLFKILVDLAIHCGSIVNIYLDPRDVMKYEVSKYIFEYAHERSHELWIANYSDLISFLQKIDYNYVSNSLRG